MPEQTAIQQQDPANRVLAHYTADDGMELSLTRSAIAYYFCPSVNDADAMRFAATCRALKLNPYLGDISLMKPKNGGPASVIVGKQALAKRADRMPDFKGIRHGIVVKTEAGAIERRKGKAIYPGETLLGGWAEVIRDGMEPFYEEVAFDEFAQTYHDRQTGETRLTSTWARMPGVMIDKVAQATAYRSAYPEEMSGLYDAAEMGEEGMATMDRQSARAINIDAVEITTPDGTPEEPSQEPSKSSPTDEEISELSSIAEAYGDKRAVWEAYQTGGMEAAHALANSDSDEVQSDGDVIPF